MNKEIETKTLNYDLVFPKPDNIDLVSGAVDLVNSYYKAGLMLPVSLDHFMPLAEKGALIVAQKTDGEVIGTAAYTQFYEKDIWEFGGWAVSEEYQNKGIGLKLIKDLFIFKPHLRTIAFGNKNSAPIFESLGAMIIEDHSILPGRAFELCLTCPKKPAIGCCDTIYDLGPIVENVVPQWILNPSR